MTRRRLIWAIVAAVVFFTVGFFLSGEARADVPSPSPQSPPVPPAHDDAFTLGAALLLVFGMAAFALLCVGVLALVEWLREKWRRTEADMVALLEATREDLAPDLTPEGRAALDANKARNIACDVTLTTAEHETFMDIVTEWRKEAGR